MSKKYSIGGDSFRARKLGEMEADDADAIAMPINPSYFKKLPEDMEPQVWLRLKSTVALFMPPDPKLGVFPMLFDDEYWEISKQAIKRSDRTDTMWVLSYHYKGKHDEDSISATLMFKAVNVATSRSRRGYDCLNLKYTMYDVQMSQNISIRIISNPV